MYQRVALVRGQAEAVGVSDGIARKGGAACPVMGEAVQGDGQFDEFGLDRRVMRFGPQRRRPEPAEQSIFVVPALLQRDHVGPALTERACGASSAALFDIAGGVEFGSPSS